MKTILDDKSAAISFTKQEEVTKIITLSLTPLEFKMLLLKHKPKEIFRKNHEFNNAWILIKNYSDNEITYILNYHEDSTYQTSSYEDFYKQIKYYIRNIFFIINLK